MDENIKKCKEIQNKYVTGRGLQLFFKDSERANEYLGLHLGKGSEIPSKFWDCVLTDPNDHNSFSEEAKKDQKELERLNEEFFKKLKEKKDDIINEIGDPLAGIDLNGVGMERLRTTLTDSGPIPNLDGKNWIRYESSEWKDWVQLSANADGNCFFHSYAIFLIGRSDLELTQRLRIAASLEFMTNFRERWNTSEEECATGNFKKLMTYRGVAENGHWMENNDIDVLGWILKRPLVVISNSTIVHLENFPNTELYSAASRDFTPTYSETWVIYNRGNHFVPLIKKN